MSLRLELFIHIFDMIIIFVLIENSDYIVL